MKITNKWKAILFLGGFFLLLYMLSLLFLPVNSMADGLYKKGNGIRTEPDRTIDCVFLGDSECSTSISPMELYQTYGIASYNCGVPAQKLQDTYYLLKQVLTKQSPTVVVLETNAFFRSFEPIQTLDHAIDEKAKKVFPLYKYHNNWKYFHTYLLERQSQKKSHIANGTFKGFTYNTTSKPYRNGSYVVKTDLVETIEDQPMYYLNKITSLCANQGITLILYSAPSPKCWSYAKHNAINEYAKSNHLPYLDENLSLNEIGIDWMTDSRDEGDHLNFYGAKKVTKFLGRYLKEHTTLPDRREDAQYHNWNVELDHYRSIIKK